MLPGRSIFAAIIELNLIVHPPSFAPGSPSCGAPLGTSAVPPEASDWLLFLCWSQAVSNLHSFSWWWCRNVINVPSNQGERQQRENEKSSTCPWLWNQLMNGENNIMLDTLFNIYFRLIKIFFLQDYAKNKISLQQNLVGLWDEERAFIRTHYILLWFWKKGQIQEC